jgi:hypothetical protein
MISPLHTVSLKKARVLKLFVLEAHRNGWHAASTYRNGILNSELKFPIFNERAGPACNLFMCPQKKRWPAIKSVCACNRMNRNVVGYESLNGIHSRVMRDVGSCSDTL